MSDIRFGEEVQALIDYGHDCCAHVDDRIHEYCQRIMEAHDEEIGSYQIALMWKEEQDAIDVARCGDTSDDGDDYAAAGRVDNCDGNRLAEEVAPITQELREHLAEFKPIDTGESIVVSRIGTIGYGKAMQLCDAIDAVHNSLERENKELRHDVEMWRDRAEDMRMERDDALKEHHAWAPESHYMMLPKDMDGEPIHLFDLMETERGAETVEGILPDRFLVLRDGHWLTVEAATHRHHTPDTWERIIKDAIGEGMARELSNYNGGYDRPDSLSNAFLVARCKALAGDAE